MSTITLHSKKKKTLVPKLRFPGFEGNWKIITLGDLLTFKNGINSDKEKYGKGVKFINVLDILNNDFITYDKIIGYVEVTEKEFEKNEVCYGDILFQRSSETRTEVGQANVYLDKNKSSVFGGFVIRGKAKYEYNPLFMNYLLRTPIARKEITDKSGGSTRYNVGQDTLSQVKLTTTTLPEQQKIASFLSAVDEKIQQLSRKAALLEQYKKGVMQQLFSGKLRFKDENGKDYPDWEEKKLGDVCEMTSSKRVYLNDYVNEGIPFYRGKEISELRLNQLPSDLLYISKKRYNDFKFKYGVPLKNDILITAVGTLGNVLRIRNDDPFYFKDGNLIWLRNISESSQFLEIILQWETKELIKTSIGSTQKALTMVELRKLTFNFPCIPEQQKIANFLSSIDIKIDGINQQLAQTQSFKKGLLQQMFV